VVVSCWLEVIVMLEVVSIRVAEVEWHVSITIIDSVQFFTIHELSNVVLDDGVLGMSSMLGSSGSSLNAVTESKDVLISSVLEGIWVDIDEASAVGNTSFNEFGVWLRWWVDVHMHEWVFDNFTAVDIFESCNLFAVFVVVNLGHFPSEHNVNTSLVAFVEGDLIGIWEFEDFLIWGPELDSSVGSCSSLKLILSHE